MTSPGHRPHRHHMNKKKKVHFPLEFVIPVSPLHGRSQVMSVPAAERLSGEDG